MNDILREALLIKIEALNHHLEALLIRQEALELRALSLEHEVAVYRRGNIHMPVATTRRDANERNENGEKPERRGRKRGRKPKNVVYTPEKAIEMALSDEKEEGSKALKTLIENLMSEPTVAINDIAGKVKAPRSIIIRDLGLLKRLNLIRFEGSKRSGSYFVTDEGKQLLSKFN